MAYSSAYNPPTASDVPALREIVLNNPDDREMYVHIGHFIAWYAAAETGVTALLHHFSGKIGPEQFDILTKGLDARGKCERVKSAVALTRYKIDDGLNKRLSHFTGVVATLRNKIVHSHLYWNDNHSLQMTSLGKPPLFAEDPLDAPLPAMVSSLELFERGFWLQNLTIDLFKAHEALTKTPHLATVGIAPYRSSLPTGDRPGPRKQAQRANADKRAQKPPRPKKERE